MHASACHPERGEGSLPFRVVCRENCAAPLPSPAPYVKSMKLIPAVKQQSPVRLAATPLHAAQTPRPTPADGRPQAKAPGAAGPGVASNNGRPAPSPLPAEGKERTAQSRERLPDRPGEGIGSLSQLQTLSGPADLVKKSPRNYTPPPLPRVKSGNLCRLNNGLLAPPPGRLHLARCKSAATVREQISGLQCGKPTRLRSRLVKCDHRGAPALKPSETLPPLDNTPFLCEVFASR
jgi:hypothetical protein